MTAPRFWLATALFHAVLLAACARVWIAWKDARRCRRAGRAWLAVLARDVVVLGLLAGATSVLATAIASLEDLRHLWLGICARLMGQAIIGEAIVLGLGLALSHRRAGCRWRSATLAAVALGLLAVYVDAYRIEPDLLRVRHHRVDEAAGLEDARTIRILHLTDIQTPAIGAHEERALRTGMMMRPDLIVLTGDYVQDAMGRPTEREAARDLRSLMLRIGFSAPLGVFATEGDVGPPCREVFAGTRVRCLVDETALVPLPGGESLAITGLSRGRGRERSTACLARLLAAAPPAAYRLFISHAPDFVDAMPARVDLVLAGHTHGGQVVLPFFGPPKTAIRLPRLYAGGLHDYEGIPLHVSRGVGMERGFAVPVRFLCPPEICVLDWRLPPRLALTAAVSADGR